MLTRYSDWDKTSFDLAIDLCGLSVSDFHFSLVTLLPKVTLCSLVLFIVNRVVILSSDFVSRVPKR